MFMRPFFSSFFFFLFFFFWRGGVKGRWGGEGVNQILWCLEDWSGVVSPARKCAFLSIFKITVNCYRSLYLSQPLLCFPG